MSRAAPGEGTRNARRQQLTGERITVQQSLAGDALNEYIHHTGSAVFAVPPGLRPGQHYGDALFT